MGYVTYTARRGLLAGVTDGDSVTLGIFFRVATPRMRPVRRTTRAIDGTGEHVLDRIEDLIDVETGPIEPADAPALRQFLRSVAGGETFTFDDLGTANGSFAPTAVNPKTVELEPGTFAETKLGAGVATSPLKWRFALREVAP